MREQEDIANDVVDRLCEKGLVAPKKKDDALRVVRKSRAHELTEFTRAVHAEMDALLSAGRQGVSVVGATAFVTTFPCHYCARHLIAAGVDAVYYIEPYTKSRTFDLHEDAITNDAKNWQPPSLPGADNKKVLFAPFTGIAPRLYARAFVKDRDLKNKETGAFCFGDPHYVDQWHLDKISYTELEAKLTNR